jgi:hypothetical protein
MIAAPRCDCLVCHLETTLVTELSDESSTQQWRVEGLDASQAESLLRALASQYGGDPAATDISRLLRLPGFANRKYNEAFVVRVHHESDAIHHLQDFHISEDSPESSRDSTESLSGIRRMPAGHRSQSEADWAYAKRALARGDDPEVVIHRIADYRADDKSDPIYYARHTVAKARAELLQQSVTGRSTEVDRSLEKDLDFGH